MKLCLIDGERVFLDHLQSVYIEPYLKSYSPLVQALLHVPDITYEFRYLCAKLQESMIFFYVVFEKKTTMLIGAVEIRSPAYRSQLYCWMNECYWGKGYFYEAMHLIIPFYFEYTKEEIISARVDCKNERSARALQRVGFTIQAIVPGPHGPQYQLQCKKQ